MEEINISDLTLEQKIAILMRDLPVPVQKFLQSPERNAISLQLAQKYKLHTDTAGIFERAYVFMLLGVFTPEEFVKELRDGGLDENTTRGLAMDVNDLVFKRLREEERVENTTPSTPAPQVPVMKVGEDIPSNLPGQAVVPPAIPTTSFVPAAPNTAVPVASAPYQPPVPQYIPVPVYQFPTTPQGYQPQPVVAYGMPMPPAARTMASDMAYAQEHPTQPAYQPHPSIQAPPPQPVVVEAQIEPKYSSPTMAPVRLTPVDNTHANAPITKEYGSDPYREPIE